MACIAKDSSTLVNGTKTVNIIETNDNAMNCRIGDNGEIDRDITAPIISTNYSIIVYFILILTYILINHSFVYISIVVQFTQKLCSYSSFKFK